jgi:radical SAM superfamily enzyme YgiQ (UPF0313 family)
MENLGVMYLSAVAKQAGHECLIVELEHAYHFAHVFGADIVGMSIMTGDMEKFKKLALSVKNRMGMTVIVGGPDPTFFPQGYDWADVIFSGEAENEFSELLGSMNRYPNIDSIPYPDRTDFPDMKIRDFIASRGCAFNCTYCYNDRWAKMFPEIQRVRVRSAKDVVKEVVSVQPEFAYFQDSCFGINKKWLREFSKEYRLQANIPFHCHMRPSQVDEEQVLLLHDANCASVRIALESASVRLRKLLNRSGMECSDVLTAVHLLRKWGIKLMIQNILGLPTSTIEDDLSTLEFNIKCKPAYAWSSIFSPYPGTALGDQCLKEGWYKGDYSDITDCFFDRSVLELPEIQKEQVYCLQKVFAFCVETQVMPELNDLTCENLPKFIHKAMRKAGDKRLYNGII